jgi:hypothetical protein
VRLCGAVRGCERPCEAVRQCGAERGCEAVQRSEGEDVRRSEGEAVRHSEALESKGLIRFSSLFFSSSSSFYLFIFFSPLCKAGRGSGFLKKTKPATLPAPHNFLKLRP